MQPYWTRSPEELLRELNSSESGLSRSAAERRLKEEGENRVSESNGHSIVRLLLRQYASPLVLILIFGAGVSLVVRQWTDATIILLIVLGSTLLGFSQEYRASEAVRRLRDRLALRATVLRDGSEATVDVRHIVRGDIVLLSAGNLVPADALVIEARDFLVTQAALTGESFPVEKTPGRVPADASMQERTNAVFLGTSVRSGTAKVVVARVGESTEVAGIAHEISRQSSETDFERGIRKFGYLLTQIMMVMVIFVMTVNLLLQRPPIESLLFAVALAVGLTPELLPAIVSVTLSAGARRMATRGVIVRRLEAIENLGGIDILCTDKTGTLTKGVVELSGAVDVAGNRSDRIFELAALNSGLETGIANPLDAAIVAAAGKRGLPPSAATKVDEIPYDFLRKRLTVVVSDDAAGGSHLIITKGAFDTVVTCCDRVRVDGDEAAFDDAQMRLVQQFYTAKGGEGFRVLGVATKRVPAQAHYDRADETGMVFEGFLLFFDPLKEGIDSSIQRLTGLGIAIKIISGDNRHVAAHVGAAIGLDPACLLTGRQLNETGDDALRHLAEQTQIFAEVDPQQKERIVRALQTRGHAVAYLGDGINDAPALHSADVGVSVDQAVDVARESADIVLLERDLDVLADGVAEGRRTFANTLKYVAITTSANFGNMVSMAIATLFVPFLPLLAKQILLNNFLSDFPSIAIASDNVDDILAKNAQRWDIKGIQLFMLIFGLVSTMFDMMTFALLLWLFQAGEALFQSTWFVVSLLTELAVVLVLRTRFVSWRSRPSPLLLASTVIVALVAIVLPYLGSLSSWFGFVPIPPHLLLTSFGIVALYIGATEVTKRWYFGFAAEGDS